LLKKEGERERKKKKNKGEYRGTYSRDWNSAVLAYGLYGGLSSNKRTLLQRHYNFRLNREGKRGHKRTN
jgi:hypothetical protein